MYAYAETDQRFVFSLLLLLKAIIAFTTLGIPSDIRKSVVVNGDKRYTMYTFSFYIITVEAVIYFEHTIEVHYSILAIYCKRMYFRAAEFSHTEP